MIMFRATVQTDPTVPLLSVLDWKPYVMGEIEVHNINCVHNDLSLPERMTEIGRILAQRLDEIHASNSKED
ncbi:hypothetical protein B0O80DRAFT_458834, partial [Mortierella sp. GBAus27b]